MRRAKVFIFLVIISFVLEVHASEALPLSLGQRPNPLGQQPNQAWLFFLGVQAKVAAVAIQKVSNSFSRSELRQKLRRNKRNYAKSGQNSLSPDQCQHVYQKLTQEARVACAKETMNKVAASEEQKVITKNSLQKL